MNFKELKQGYNLYILDISNVEYTTEKVTSVSMPHIDAKLSSTGMVVDITTDKNTYCMLADTDVAYPYGKVIATDTKMILRELQVIRTNSQQRIDNIHNDEETVSRCNILIADLDPAQREKQATEARFAKIEQGQAQIMAMLQKLTTP